jgi:hypothetical protein
MDPSLLLSLFRNGNASPMIEHFKATPSITEQEPHIPFTDFVIYLFGFTRLFKHLEQITLFSRLLGDK